MESEKLKNYIIEQAKFFLAQAGEFYPFGAVIGSNGSVIPLGVQLEDDHPQSQVVIEILENAVIKKLRNKEAKLAGIGTDVFYKPVGSNERKSSIQIRILRSDGESTDCYLPYRKEGEEIVYEDALSEKGTLNF